MRNDTRLIGIGLYSIPEAATFTGVAPARIRRWLKGYRHVYEGDERGSPPLWRPQVPEINGVVGLGFRDLAEIRIVDALVKAGLGLPTIRLAILKAREFIDDERPFSTSQFKTDGRSIFLEIVDQANEPRLLDLLKNQYGLHRVISPSFRDIDFDKDGAIRWWPLNRKRHVVLDPARSFGQPIINVGGVPTAALAAAVEKEGSIPLVARYFEVSKAAVRNAVAFEQQLTN